MLWWRYNKKKKMKMIGKVEIPSDAFLSILKSDEIRK